MQIFGCQYISVMIRRYSKPYQTWSTAAISDENLFAIRPIGVTSKKEIGAQSTRDNSLEWIRAEERTAWIQLNPFFMDVKATNNSDNHANVFKYEMFSDVDNEPPELDASKLFVPQ